MRLLKKTVIITFFTLLVLTCFTVAVDVLVADHTIPEIVFEADTLDVSVKDGEQALLRGLMAYDEKDGSLTSGVFLERTTKLIGEGTVKANYVVFDRDGHVGKASRYIHYTDYHAPRFALSTPLIYSQGSALTLTDRLTASDVLDGDITYKISVDNQNLTTAATGSFELTARVTNSLGDCSIISLPVLIENISRTQPVIVLEDYLIYLDQNDSFKPLDYFKYVVIDGSNNTDSSSVSVDSDVDTSEAGTYNVYYTARNSSNETGTAILTVVVQ